MSPASNLSVLSRPHRSAERRVGDAGNGPAPASVRVAQVLRPLTDSDNLSMCGGLRDATEVLYILGTTQHLFSILIKCIRASSVRPSLC
ncbi:hypothetical protein VTO73DRAFT_12133 [Trametes versicolor]